MLTRRLQGLARGLRRRPPATLDPRRGYDLWAPTYDSGMNPVQVLEAEALQRLLPDLRERVVLDIGCGKGRCSALARERGARRTVGIDLSAAMLSAARLQAATSSRPAGPPAIAGRQPAAEAAATSSTAAAHWTRGDVVGLPFRDARFDVVFCTLVLGHVASLETAVAEIARVLRPAGTLLVSGFHPYATMRGWQRTFTDPGSGRTFAIEQHLHLFEDYLRCFRGSGIVVEALEEPRYEGVPLVFAMRATRAEARS